LDRLASHMTFQKTNNVTTLLELSFVSQNIRMICENEDKAKEMLGAPVALTLKSRLADMRAAMFVSELLAGSPGEIVHNNSPAYKLDLTTQERLVFCCVHETIPLLTNGNTDWHQVSRVKLVNIGSKIC